MVKYKIAIIPGDGIGPEIMEATLDVLGFLKFNAEFILCKAGYKFWKEEGVQITEDTLEVIRECDSCLKGPTMTPYGPRTYKSVAVILRQELDLYANVRPIKSREGVKALHKDVDFIIVRENTEDLYRGIEYSEREMAVGLRIITRSASERIARFAFELARNEGRKKITIVHKANIFKETCGLFRNVCFELAKKYPDIETEEMLVDAAALKIITNPKEFDILLTTNVFGDILSDEAAGIIGSIGLVPSANLGDKYSVFEPVHGVALDIAGKGMANPCSLLLSSVLMLKHLNEKEEALRLEAAIERVLEEGRHVTFDLGGKASTKEMMNAIIEKLGSIA